MQQQQQQMRNQQQHYGYGAQVQQQSGVASSGYGGATPAIAANGTAVANNPRMNYATDSAYPVVDQQNYGAYKGSGGSHGRVDRSYRPY